MNVARRIIGFLIFALFIVLCNNFLFENVQTETSIGDGIFLVTLTWLVTYAGWVLMTKFNKKFFYFFLFYLGFLIVTQILMYSAHSAVDFKNVWYFDGDYTMISFSYLALVLSVILYIIIYVYFGTGEGSVKISRWFIFGPAILCLVLFYFGARDYRYIDKDGFHYFTYFGEQHYKWSQIERVELDSRKDRTRTAGIYTDDLELNYLIYPKNKDPYEVYMDNLDLKPLFDLNEKLLTVIPDEYYVVRPADNEYPLLKEAKDWLPKKDYNELITLFHADKKKLK